MAGVGTSKGIAKVKSTVEIDETGNPTTTSLTEYSEFKKAIAKSPALVSGYSKLLKSAGYYRGPVTSKYTPALQKALDRAEEDRLSISAIRPIGRDEFLNEQINLSGGGDGKARTTTQTYIANDTDIEALVDKIYKTATGYGATAKQVAEAKKVLRREEKLNPVVQQYDSSGNLVQSGGINEEQFLTEQVAQTGAAQKTRAEVANQLMLRELGGLQ
jgi:hypothetical protein